eukprot:scaffold119472_cov21-Tisochrysis_lutea.AAC.1
MSPAAGAAEPAALAEAACLCEAALPYDGWSAAAGPRVSVGAAAAAEAGAGWPANRGMLPMEAGLLPLEL